MVVIQKGNTQSECYVTITENINKFPTEVYDPLLYIVNDTFGTTYSIYPLTNSSPSQGRYDKFEISEPTYDFRLGQHTYTFFMNATSSSILEVGKWNVVGTISSTASAWYNNVYQ
jgi:hypothetical protein